VCLCKDGFFGVWCQNKIYKFEGGDLFTQDVILAPFQSFYFKENYDVGEPGTTIEIKAKYKPMMAMILNQRDETNNTIFVQENNVRESQTSILTSWINDMERKSFDQEKDNLFVQLTNMASTSIDIKVSVSSSPP
jgi:hypothetical protein